MCSNGQTLKLVLLLILFQSSIVTAEEGGWIAMPGQIEEDQLKEGIENKDNPYSLKKQKTYLGKDTNEKSEYIGAGETSEARALIPGVNNTNILPPSTVPINSYIEVSNQEILDKVNSRWSDGFGFAYFVDSYTYDDQNGVYNSTFKNGTESSMYGNFMFRFKKRIGSIFFTKINAGFGYARGKGFFIPDGVTISTPEVSTTEIKLYSVPLELGLGAKGNFSRYLNLSLSGGGGVMGLWQHRDDREQDADDKNIRQVGFGYFGEATLGFALSQIFNQLGVDLLSQYEVSNFNFELSGRIQNYSGFKNEDITISGTSFGLGFSFEYL